MTTLLVTVNDNRQEAIVQWLESLMPSRYYFMKHLQKSNTSIELSIIKECHVKRVHSLNTHNDQKIRMSPREYRYIHWYPHRIWLVETNTLERTRTGLSATSKFCLFSVNVLVI